MEVVDAYGLVDATDVEVVLGGGAGLWAAGLRPQAPSTVDAADRATKEASRR